MKNGARRPPRTPLPPPPPLSGPRLGGTVVRIMRDRGFGFIKGLNQQQYFFHMHNVDDFEGLREGDAVSFVVVAAAKGPRAEAVQREEL